MFIIRLFFVNKMFKINGGLKMRRSGFSMIELVFVIVILGVLAAVAVPRFVATRTDATVATLRSDAASVQKAIVAKVFADNIDTTSTLAPAPNDPTKTPSISWSDWMIEVGGLDKSRWMQAIPYNNGRGISPSVKDSGVYMPCGSSAMILIQANGDLYFNPAALSQDTAGEPTLCKKLKASYATSDGTYGNRTIPLASTGTLEF